MRIFNDFNNTNRLKTEAAANPVIPPAGKDEFLKSDQQIEAEFLTNLNKKPNLIIFPSYKKTEEKPNDPVYLLNQLEATSSLEENY